MKWIRTCQECGHKQETKKPSYSKADGQLAASYANSICRKCKSPALDFGSEVDEEESAS